MSNLISEITNIFEMNFFKFLMVVIPSFFPLDLAIDLWAEIWEAVVGYGMVCQCLAVVEWFFYIYLLVWMPMSLLKCKSTVYGGFLKMFSLCFIQNFHTNIYGVYFFLSKQNLMNFWLCDFNNLFWLFFSETLLWFTLLFFHLFSIYSFLSLL